MFIHLVVFRRLRDFMANRPTFRMIRHIDNRLSVLETTRGLLRRLKMSRTLVQNVVNFGPQNGGLFPTVDQ